MAIEQTDPKEPKTETDSANSTEVEQVEIHEASIEDLDSALAEAQKAEKDALPEGPEVPTPAKDEGSGPSKGSEGVTSNGSSNKTDQGLQTSEAVAGRDAAASKPRVYTQDEIDAIAAENARLKKDGNQKELFIQRRNTELGTLRSELSRTRKDLLAARQQLTAGLQDKFQEDPVRGIEDREKIKEIEAQIEGIDNQEARASRVVEAQTFFVKHVDTENVSPQDIAEVLKADGLTEQHIAQFLANPWEWTTPEALVQMGKRAEDRKGHQEALDDRMILARHVLHLQAEIEKLNKRPGQLVQTLQKNLSRAPTVTSASTSAAKSLESALDPTRMTVAELDAALKNARAQ